MKKNNSIGMRLLLCLCELLIGIVLLINPGEFTKGIITVTGALLILSGIICIIKYFRTEVEEAIAGQGIIKGLCEIGAGIFFIVKSEWFIETFPIITVIYGVIILITGIMRIQWTVDMLRLKEGKWYFTAIGALVALICGTIIILNPFAARNVLWIFTEVALIVEAVMDLVIAIMLKIDSKKAEAPSEPEAEQKNENKE